MLAIFSDVIAAISTPPGRSGIAIIRLSGQDVVSIVRPFLSLKSFEPNTIKYSLLKTKENIIDEVLVSYFQAPKSFTGEDMIEINCHGNYVLAKQILNLFYKNGARSAEPGEFTMRAVVNGKIDLVQAESIIDMIDAKTAKSAGIASSHLQGILSEQIANLRKRLLDIVSHIEVHLDYPEEEDIKEETYYMTLLEDVISKTDELLRSFNKGKLYKDGLVFSIIGKPNVGKSSLFNKWLEENRAIVSDIPGTTRDTIEEWVELNGIPVKLVDTAGIRVSEDQIEKMGIERTKDYLKRADIVIAIFDAELGIDGSDKLLLEDIELSKTIFLINKTDLASGEKVYKYLLDRYDTPEVVFLSVLKDSGWNVFNERLQQKIEKLFNITQGNEDILLNNERHQESLIQAKEAIIRAKEAVLMGTSEDLWVSDLKDAMVYLGQIVGQDVSEEVLENIFSRFCVGK